MLRHRRGYHGQVNTLGNACEGLTQRRLISNRQRIRSISDSSARFDACLTGCDQQRILPTRWRIAMTNGFQRLFGRLASHLSRLWQEVASQGPQGTEQCHHRPTNRNSSSVAAESLHVWYVCVILRDQHPPLPNPPSRGWTPGATSRPIPPSLPKTNPPARLRLKASATENKILGGRWTHNLVLGTLCATSEREGARLEPDWRE